MRHGKKFRSLSRTKSHRKALLGNLASELIKHKRIKTTLAKGKELRKYVEPILTRAKTDSVHSRRMVFKSLLSNSQADDLVKELFSEIALKIADRPGGYTRIIKLPPRLGDNAPMCYIELVDYNELLLAESKPKAKRTRRGRKKKSTESAPVLEANKLEETTDDLTKIEGIGPKIAEVLVAGGLTTFSKIAETAAEDIKKILNEAEGNFGAHIPTTWPQQAKLASEGKWDELKQLQDELDGGKVAENKSEEE